MEKASHWKGRESLNAEQLCAYITVMENEA